LRQHSDYVTCLAAAEKNVTYISLSFFGGGCPRSSLIAPWKLSLHILCKLLRLLFSNSFLRNKCSCFQGNIVASGGLGGEVFIWDIEAAVAPVSKSNDGTEEEASNGINSAGNTLPITSLRTISSSSNINLHSTSNHGYVPTAAKGHKESVYALAMNDSGTILVSGGTEKV